MSEQRRYKLARKIKDCLDKDLHPKVSRRLQAKLDSALVRDAYGDIEQYHRVLQSARATIKQILKETRKHYASLGDETTEYVISDFITMSELEKMEVEGEYMTKNELWDYYSKLTHLFTKVNRIFFTNVMMLNGLLISFNKGKTDVLGVPNDGKINPMLFYKCGVLADKLSDLIVADIHREGK